MREPRHLEAKLAIRREQNALRSLALRDFQYDFFSNDYLGFARSETIHSETLTLLKNQKNGATGSRLLSGNYPLIEEAEQLIGDFHRAEALLFNSGYDANVGFFSSVPQRGDIVLYDAYIHASIRDGLAMGLAKTYKFRHNDLNDLEHLLKKFKNDNSSVFVVTESVFSMDGDTPDLVSMSELCNQYDAYFVIDEAHSIGVFGSGLTQHLKLENQIFARIITYGKAFGCHGATVLGSSVLKQYLVNFARSFIYTTAMPPHSVANIMTAYKTLPKTENIKRLHEIITHFRNTISHFGLADRFIPSDSSIQALIVSGNSGAKSISAQLQAKGFGVMPILPPTVPKGQERLRFCLHSYNTEESITELIQHCQRILICD